jgi:hypothetical protein
MSQSAPSVILTFSLTALGEFRWGNGAINGELSIFQLYYSPALVVHFDLGRVAVVY